MNVPDVWRPQPNLNILNTISIATEGIQKYNDTSDRTGYDPTPTWRAAAQTAVLKWMRYTDPDAEDLRSNLETIYQTGSEFGCNSYEFSLLSHHRVNQLRGNPYHDRLVTAQDLFAADSLGSRHFGDANVHIPHEFSLSIPHGPTERALYMAHSNGCPAPRGYLAKIRELGIISPSLSHQPNVVPELNHYFDQLDPSLQVHIWDNARANRLWQGIMGVVQESCNQALYYDIMHVREELPDSAGEIESMPRKMADGSRPVRFLALSSPYQIVKEIWTRFDGHCEKTDYQTAETTFDQDINLLAGLIQQATTIVDLAQTFHTSLS